MTGGAFPRHLRRYLVAATILYALPLSASASCNGSTTVFCWWLADPPAKDFEWPGAGVCKPDSYGLLEFCLRNPEPPVRQPIVFNKEGVRPAAEKPSPFLDTVTEVFARLVVVAWLAVCVLGLLLLCRKGARKAHAMWSGKAYVAVPLKLQTTTVFVGAAGAACVILGSVYQLHRLQQDDLELWDRATAEIKANVKCRGGFSINFSNNQTGRELAKECSPKGDIAAKLDANARKMTFLFDWTRPAALGLFLLFCVPWLSSWLLGRKPASSH